jgi:hypothetical protein
MSINDVSDSRQHARIIGGISSNCCNRAPAKEIPITAKNITTHTNHGAPPIVVPARTSDVLSVACPHRTVVNVNPKKFTRPFRRVDECSWQKSRTRGVESPHARRKPTRLFIVGWIMRGPLYEEEAALDTPAGKTRAYRPSRARTGHKRIE